LKTGWGKSVPIPTKAAYGAFAPSFLPLLRASESEGLIHCMQWRTEPASDSAYARAEERTRAPRPRSRSRSPSSHSRSDRLLTPEDPHEFLRFKRPRSRSHSPVTDARPWPTLEGGADEKFLATVARKVRDNGGAFETVLRERERENERFAFLRDEGVRLSLVFFSNFSPSEEEDVANR
jgi:U2-associated protein SR140